ncbi:MAG: 16S rRNA (uracil(1498)-N(3))-methyltransferase [Candidatus Omnitrophica bacterium]|nr:16S rRNA (uracil(1498)-N(3))-methyltransferase [Candidatus Omnitrophota bacterium]MBU1923049.1 16S rRNA (uracil(1498)-N(3))-methyltransferase [Candidatus Omnitrophota bacterium]
MNRFFVDKVDAVDAKDKYIIISDPAQLHHLRDVLRIKPLELVVVFDNCGNEYITVVVEIGIKAVKLKVKEKMVPKDLGVSITVACAIPKKVKMDDIVDKLTQLGVECIIPLETERVIVRLDKQKKIERFQRWEKIALSAAKQSQRSKLAVIKPISALKDVLSSAKEFDLKLIPTLEGNRISLKEVINQEYKKTKKIIILIGPEGDFTYLEIALAKKAGFLPVSLGARVLRVDTAAVAVVSFIKLNEAY